ncbi:hypothetical protein AGMMS49942_06630 [Spirochaetia bacterium]|nr:hypothetical protein AGMMS49942_06630 [Spirochaetia bacterium]
MSGLRLLALAGFTAGVILALPTQGFSLGRRDAGKAPRTEAAPTEPAADAALYESAVGGRRVEVSGRVRLVGSEPFPDLVLTDTEEHTWYIDSADRKTLSRYEQQTVTIRGTVELKEMVLANGRSLGTRRTLSGITLVRVDE